MTHQTVSGLPRGARALPVLTLLLVAGCASPSEHDLRTRRDGVRESLYETPSGNDAALRPPFRADAPLDDYLQHAFLNNPALRAAFDRWHAALERIPQARALDDPTLSFEYFVEQMDARYQASLTQMFPALGVLRLRQDRAAAEARAAMHAFEAERVDLYGRVTQAFHEYHYLGRATAVTEEHVGLLAELEQAVEARYRAGDVAFADLIKVQVEKERLADRLASLRDQRRARSAGLAALLHLPAEAVLPWPRTAPPGEVTVDEAALAGILADLNPELKSAEAMIEAAAHREGLARRSGWPRIMLGAGYMVMPGMEGRGNESDIGLMTGVTLPVWRGRVRAERREAEALRQAATHNHDDMRNRLRAELSMAVFQFRDAERRIGLFAGSLAPKAEQALEVARQAYADGRAGFMTLIDAQRMLLDFQLLAERAAADREIALSDISCCVGATLADLFGDEVSETKKVPYRDAKQEEKHEALDMDNGFAGSMSAGGLGGAGRQLLPWSRGTCAGPRGATAGAASRGCAGQGDQAPDNLSGDGRQD